MDVNINFQADEKSQQPKTKEQYRNNPCLVGCVVILVILVIGAALTIGVVLSNTKCSTDDTTTPVVGRSVDIPPGTVPIQGTFRLNDWHYHPALADINSTMAKAYAAAICDELTGATKGTDAQTENCLITGFSPGSVVAAFLMVVFNTKQLTTAKIQSIAYAAIKVKVTRSAALGLVTAIQLEVNYCQDSANNPCDQLCIGPDNTGSECACRSGYLLDTDGVSCTDIDECVVNSDICDQECVNSVGSYTCACREGYQINATTDTCIDVNECITNNGECKHMCVNSVGSYRCECAPGYNLAADSKSCQEIDHCESSPCLNGGSCHNAIESFVCLCQLDYTGETCHSQLTALDLCAVSQSPCQNGGSCVAAEYTCTCPQGLCGVNCDQDIDECLSSDDNDCDQDCVNTYGSFSCDCSPGFMLDKDDKTCIDVNECLWIGCDFCSNTIGSYMCGCPEGTYLNKYDEETCFNLTTTMSIPGNTSLLRGSMFQATCYANVTRGKLTDGNPTNGNTTFWNIALRPRINDDLSIGWYDSSGSAISRDVLSGGTFQSSMILDGVVTAVMVGLINQTGRHDFSCRVQYHQVEISSNLKVYITDLSHCNGNETKCYNGRCISSSLRCNGWNDCGDNSDELDCRGCKHNEYNCANGECVPIDLVCNNVTDCTDATDEANCWPGGVPTYNCTMYEFACRNDNGTCIAASSLCDGRIDCYDGSDERYCGNNCSFGEFRCFDGKCINSSLVCDGRHDCGDLSDETGCPVPPFFNRTCPLNQFQCHETCLPFSLVCDGHVDCYDASDEMYCNLTSCNAGLLCRNGNCASFSDVCDDYDDCGDLSDEAFCQSNTSVYCNATERMCDTGQCLPDDMFCDGQYQCYDGSDEWYCGGNCSLGEFHCGRGQCISIRWLCDGAADCADGNDEWSCPGSCHNQFSCDNGRCVDYGSVCNNWDDCGDYSDEVNCPDTEYNRTCRYNEFQCISGQCIEYRDVCDALSTCGDGSDEQNCNRTHCDYEEYQCLSGQCVPYTVLCDGTPDCSDASDEYLCNGDRSQCNSTERMCNTGQCLPIYLFCDGEPDCLDGSDEWNCTGKGRCNQTESSCNNGTCIPSLWLCDGTPDCPGGIDEWFCSAQCLGRFYCSNGRCVDLNNTCNGWDDCGDYSDETHCSTPISNRTCTNREFQCHNGQCVPYSNVCDRYPDCADNTDEVRCNNTCAYDEFVCGRGNCIPYHALCDDFDDCGGNDTADERFCNETFSCGPREMMCNYGECVPLSWRCDGTTDCHDGSDEANCTVCPTYYRPCRNGTCLKDEYFCDGQNNCADWSDEADCEQPVPIIPPFVCRQHEYLCVSDGFCVPMTSLCNGSMECSDGSDEESCNITCAIDQFHCDDGFCVSASGLCDGYWDCADGSDERNCTTNCTDDGFSCSNGTQCLHMSLVCNGRVECHDMTDERGCICEKDQFRCADGMCLFEHQWCDGVADCRDRSDEPFDCRTCVVKCSPNQVHCDGTCISGNEVCDGIRHCSDGQDEMNCTCAEAMCDDTTCIRYDQVCNKHKDCLDGSDERRCMDRPCDPARHLMECDGRCAPLSWKCDEKLNCADKSDEQGCGWVKRRDWLSDDFENNLVLFNMAPCNDGVWINTTKWCDGVRDCPDGSDEFHGCIYGCPNGYFKCNNGECIPNEYTCDYWPDCKDHTDELLCDKRLTPCPPTFLTDGTVDLSRIPKIFHDMTECSNGLCMPRAYICDHQLQCADSSDEEELCWKQKPECEDGFFRCKSGKCIDKSWLCDGDNDCGDFGDEMVNCSCSNDTSVRCGNGVCLSNHYLCDGEKDCPDGRDEASCECPAYQRKCDNGLCIRASYMCDGHNDCGDWSDEMHCPACQPNEFACRGDNFTMCVPTSRYCDRIPDCPGGEDESESCHTRCPAGTFACDGRCFADHKKCDGVVNCANMEDEADCACKYDQFYCGVCRHRQSWCDGVVDCPDGSDESSCTSVTSCPAQFHMCYDDSTCYSPVELCTGLVRCDNFSVSYDCADLQVPEYTCGQPAVQPLRTAKFIFGGEEAIPHSWPWQISLLIDNFRGTTFRHHCGGTIIDKQWIITAAHCFDDEKDPTAYRVLVGSHSQDVAEMDENLLTVKRIVMHANYDEYTIENDIALVMIGELIEYSANVMPVCLNAEDVDEDAECITTGWGTTLESGDDSVLNQASAPIIDQQECKSWYADLHVVTGTMICAGHRDGRAGTCHGDSGGPLVCQASTDDVYTLHGVTSFGRNGCQSVEAPAVYTRVAKYVTWIEAITGTLRNVIRKSPLN